VVNLKITDIDSKKKFNSGCRFNRWEK